MLPLDQSRCQDEYFWRPSSCRSDPSKCVVFVTGGDGWDIPHAPQRAAAYNMPFYWWTPDDSFIEMQPTKLILPTYDAYAWTLSDYTTAAADIKTAKIVPKDLTIMAPDVVKLLAASLFDSAAVDSMMLNMKTNSLTREQAACAWLKGNDVRWNMWIPDSTKCDPGFGLYDDATEVFTAQRTTATTCRACLPGMLSKEQASCAHSPMFLHVPFHTVPKFCGLDYNMSLHVTGHSIAGLDTNGVQMSRPIPMIPAPPTFAKLVLRASNSWEPAKWLVILVLWARPS